MPVKTSRQRHRSPSYAQRYRSEEDKNGPHKEIQGLRQDIKELREDIQKLREDIQGRREEEGGEEPPITKKRRVSSPPQGATQIHRTHSGDFLCPACFDKGNNNVMNAIYRSLGSPLQCPICGHVMDNPNFM